NLSKLRSSRNKATNK
ncbi:HAD ATPase, P-type, IC family protein, partial [Vibrio parahaemolyticus V-223/04]